MSGLCKAKSVTTCTLRGLIDLGPMPSAHYAVMVLLATAAGSAAQSRGGWGGVQALTAGTEVRVAVARSKPVRGKLETVTETSLNVDAGSGPQSIDRLQITQVSVKTKARRKRSAAIGLAVGAGAGAGFGGAVASACSGSICQGHGAALVAGSMAGGAIVGALIGAAVSHGGWREIYRQ